MKHFSARFAHLGSILLMAGLSIASSSAATNHLNGPRGMAIDSKGNLYVANESGNNVAVFSPAYAFLKAKTMTANVSHPTGVAFDGAGNLYVANLGSQSITQYSPTGVQNTGATITQAVSNPQAIAIDGIDNIYVDNGYSTVSIYRANLYPASGNAAYVQTYTPSGPIFSMATRGQFFAWGGVSVAVVQSIDWTLTGHDPIELLSYANEACGVAFDQLGNLYVVNVNNQLFYYNITDSTDAISDLPFTPAGIAIDTVRDRMYISNQQGNSISVYSTTTGALLTTIQ
jgi:sugar lactone lactonase YvrE